MKNSRMRTYAMLATLTLFTLSLVLGCGGSNVDLPKDISGTWQRAEGNGTVEINLVKEPLSVTMDGKTYPAVISKVDKGSFSMHIKVENGGGEPEEWILREVWNDNGSDYTLAFFHHGTQEKLLSNRKS